jgi:hypothetical protein
MSSLPCYFDRGANIQLPRLPYAAAGPRERGWSRSRPTLLTSEPQRCADGGDSHSHCLRPWGCQKFNKSSDERDLIFAMPCSV